MSPFYVRLQKAVAPPRIMTRRNFFVTLQNPGRHKTVTHPHKALEDFFTAPYFLLF